LTPFSEKKKAMQKVIALVEDDDIIRENYSELLSDAGFEVNAYANRKDALEGMTASPPDLALLDITLGSERDAGYQLCADLRGKSSTLPIVFLTAHDGEIDKISGMRLGADDYITKDSSIDYIIIRIEALFRRIESLADREEGSQEGAVNQKHPNSSLRLDRARCEAFWKDELVGLTLTQFWMLENLYEQPGKVRRISEIMKAANIVVEPNTVVAHVKAIRDSFRTVDTAFNCIRTERGKGYRWLES
jgi:two-component system OmpR family response regulator